MNKIGKIKDDSEGKIIVEFVGLKSEIYSLINVDSKENKKGKRVNGVVVKGPYTKYVGGGPEGFCRGHEIF